MQTQNRKFILYQLLIQLVICALFIFALVNVLINAGQKGGFEGLLEPGVEYGPFLIVLVCSILPQIALLIKHKLHSQDGEILPILFTVIALQASIIVNDALRALGYYFEFPFHLLVFQRFAVAASASLFLLSALRYFGFSSSHIGMFNFAFMAVPFFISAIIPVSSYHGETTITSSLYDAYLQAGIAIVYIAAITTFIVMAFKDKTALNIKRSVAFILLSIGNYFCLFNELWSAVISPVFYVIGTIILVNNAGDSL